MRIIEPVAGLPRITIRFRPTSAHGHAQHGARARQQSHPLLPAAISRSVSPPTRRSSYMDREAPFVLTRPVSLVFGADTPFEGDLATPAANSPSARATTGRSGCAARDFLRMAGRRDPRRDHAQALPSRRPARSSRRIPRRFPRAPARGRNWDYRFCWLRDAYFVVRALNRIGATRTMEDYISYILTTDRGPKRRAAAGLQHHIRRSARGAHRCRPARVIAATGRCASAMRRWRRTSTTPTAARSSPRRRCSSTGGCRKVGDENLFRRLEPLGERALQLAFVPDAGIWEYRERKRIHTHSVAMCWAGCQRLEAIAAHLGLEDRASLLGRARPKIQAEMLEKAWNPARNAFTAAFGSDDLDASVLLLPELGAIEATDPRFVVDRQCDGAGTQTRSSCYALQQC